MAIDTRYVFIASMDVSRERQRVFDRVYDEDHIPNLLKVPGVRSAVRFRRRGFQLVIGGELKTVSIENEPRNAVLYEIDDPSVLVSTDWSRQVEAGRWPSEVRPFTSNRRHVLLERLMPD